MSRALTALLMLVAGCESTSPLSDDRSAAASTVVELAPNSKPPTDATEYLALVVPRHTVEVRSEIAGELVALHAALGEPLRAGALVAELDNPDLRLALKEAEVETKRSRTQLRASRDDSEFRADEARRVAALRGVVSDDERRRVQHDARRATSSSATARTEVDVERLRVARLETRVSALHVAAPFDARLAAIHRSPGQRVLADEPLVRLVSEERVVRFAVPSAETASLRVGQTIRFSSSDEPTPTSGRIVSIAPELDAADMLLVEATLDGDALPRIGTRGAVELDPSRLPSPQPNNNHKQQQRKRQ